MLILCLKVLILICAENSWAAFVETVIHLFYEYKVHKNNIYLK